MTPLVRQAALAATLAAALALPLGAQGAHPREATSTWFVARDTAGEVSRTLLNRTFGFAHTYLGQEGVSLLLMQETRSTTRRDVEGTEARVHVEAWARGERDSTYARRLWVIDSAGDRVRALERHYEVLQYGCCAMPNTTTWYSLRTGRPVVSFTEGPVTLAATNHAELPTVVLLSPEGAATSPALAADSLAFAELLLVDGDSVVSRAVLSATARAHVPQLAVAMTVTTGSDSTARGHLYLRQGERATVGVWSPDGDLAVAIPIRSRAFSLEGAVLPPTVRARLR